MLSSVLRSKQAVAVNIQIMRVFVRLRELLASHKDLARKNEMIERQQKEHAEQLQAVFTAVRKLMEPPAPKKRRIGFMVDDDN